MTKISYKKMKIKMLEHNLNFSDMPFSSHTLTKLKNDEPVRMSVLEDLCEYFMCNLSELVEIEYIPD